MQDQSSWLRLSLDAAKRGDYLDGCYLLMVGLEDEWLWVVLVVAVEKEEEEAVQQQ